MRHIDTSADRYRRSPEHVTVVEHARIPLSDGTELAARIWLPASARENPAPAVLEYIPYRKNDMTAPRDLTIHPEFARAGYASIRVDLRGSGDSEGTMADEYAESELADGVEVLAWIGRQDWCSGRVGIIGKSWGGFNGLQLAARRPPELAAIITVCSTDDRYADDVHYNGGAIVGSEMLSWASTMLSYNARPADPKVVGEGWREDWFRRIDEGPDNIQDWLSHQRRDDYWKHGSVCEDHAAIQVPVLAVGGLLDEYRTTLFRLMENAEAPVHALLGPWAHNYPHQGAPGPAIDFIAEAVRWWDRWMLDVENGVESQPRLRAFIPESAPLGSDVEVRPGRWVAERSWPSPRVPSEEWSAADAVVAGPRTLSSTAMLGYTAGSWLQFGDAAAQPLDQAADDARSWTATWNPREEPLDVLGTPEVELTVRSSTDRGLLAVRLCDVAPDGESRLLTMGLFNLTHRDSHEHPEPLTPGEPVTVRFPLLATAHRFAPGHRVRVSVSASLWPIAWPTGTRTEVTVEGEPTLVLPVRERLDDEFSQPELRLPPAPPAIAMDSGGAPMERRLEADLVAGTATVTTYTDSWSVNHSDGLRYFDSETDSYSRAAGDPLSPVAECRRVVRIQRPAGEAPSGVAPSASGAAADAWPPAVGASTGARRPDHAGLAADRWDVEIRTISRMFGDESSFTVTNELVALEDGVTVKTRSTSSSIPRDLL